MTVAMIMAASLVGLITGYTLPLISLEQAGMGTGTMTIGILAALPAVGMMGSSFATPWLSRRYRLKSLTSVSLMLLAAATLSSCLLHNVWALIIPRLLTGISAGILVVLGESWITGRASAKHSATLTGLYTATFTGCQLAGPLLISAGEQYQFAALSAICLIAAATIVLIRTTSVSFASETAQPIRWRSMAGFLPVLASGVFCFAFFDASVLALFPLYGMAQGLSEQHAMMLVTVILAGDALLQVPLGYLADRAGIRRVHIASGVIFCLMMLLLPFLFSSPVLLVLASLLLGAFAGALYTLSLVRAGKLLAGQKLIMMNAILGLVWSAGSISGPVVSGAMISLTGYHGLAAILCAAGMVFIGLQLMAPEQAAQRASQQDSSLI
ncbi:MFS transporter [Erwinia sp. V71]|uniref:MFS transporter n=1 Tax=Erwinia sp. V71 TaxID=3369424 RepID=UPI003F5F4C99